MSTWDVTELPDEKCSQCGAEYKVKYESLPLKDKDRFICSCGNTIREWKETGMYMYEAIKKYSGS